MKIEKFLGRELVIPEDRLYDIPEGLWIRELSDGRFAVGLTEPCVLMAGALREIERLAEDGARVEAGQTVLLLLTARLKYVATPAPGIVTFSHFSEEFVTRLLEDPYETELFFVTAETGQPLRLADAGDYAESLRDSEGARNPGGHKGGVSPTCKAVYMGLGGQRLHNDS